jgi:osmotically-inducible protein OsmY
MKLIVSRFVLLPVTLMLAQVQGQSQSQTVSPTFSQEQVPKEQMPPDQQAPPPRLSTPEKIQQQIEQQLNSEPALQNSKVSVRVDEDLVILNGTVSSEQQRDLALRIAQSYAGDRKIVDKIQVTQQT